MLQQASQTLEKPWLGLLIWMLPTRTGEYTCKGQHSDPSSCLFTYMLLDGQPPLQSSSWNSNAPRGTPEWGRPLQEQQAEVSVCGIAPGHELGMPAATRLHYLDPSGMDWPLQGRSLIWHMRYGNQRDVEGSCMDDS